MIYSANNYLIYYIQATWKIIKRKRNQYAEKYKRALMWLKENDYVNIVKISNENGEEDISILK